MIQLVVVILVASFTWANACPTDWAQLDAGSMKSTPDTCFYTLTPKDLAVLTPSACSAINEDFLLIIGYKYLDSSPCGGFQPNCIGQIPPSSMAGMSASCSANLSPEAFAAITADQVQHVTNVFFLGVDEQKMALWNTQCAGLQEYSVGILESSQIWQTCAGISGHCLGLIPENSFALMTNKCFEEISPESFSALTANQISKIPLPLLSDISAEQLHALNSSCAGLATLAMFSPPHKSPLCSSLRPECIKALPNQAIETIAPTCLRYITPFALMEMSADQLSHMSLPTTEKLSQGQLRALGKVCGGFTREQVMSLGLKSPFDACQGMSSECLKDIQTLDALTGNCIGKMDPNAFDEISQDQALNMSSKGISGLGAEDFVHILETVGSNISSEYSFAQLSLVNTTVISEIHAHWAQEPFFTEHSSACNGSTVLSKQWLDLSFAQNNSINCILPSSTQPETLAGLRSGHYPYLNSSFMGEINSHTESLVHFSSDFIGEFSSADMAQLKCQTFSSATSSFMNSLSNETIPTLSTQQLDAFVNSYLFYNEVPLSCRFFQLVTNEQFNVFNSYLPWFLWLDYKTCPVNYTPGDMLPSQKCNSSATLL